MSSTRTTLAAITLGLLFACQSMAPPPAVVASVDLERYAGTWYEIASYPQIFQRGCVATQARYSLREDGRLGVVNECRDGDFDGDVRRVEGIAWVDDPARSAAKLRVRFFWPFSGAYWVIALDEDYQHAVVASPDRDALWILSRTRTMDAPTYAALLEHIEAQGFDLVRLRRTPQPDA